MNAPTNRVRTGHPNRRKTLPRQRSELSQILIGLVGTAFMLGGVLTAKTEHSFFKTFLILASLILPVLVLVELMFRLLYFFEEYRHLLTRYENNVEVLLKDVFYFSYSSWAVGVLSIFIYMWVYMEGNQHPYKVCHNWGPTSLLLSLMGTLFLNRVCNLQRGPLYDSMWIESNRLDYGSGMANSFFYGYLNLIIPKTGTDVKNLEELMKDYEDRHTVELVFYKLFILIPKSFHCFTSLKDTEFSPSIEESSSLAGVERTVAGVRDRVYKNSVYKIRNHNGDKIYVAAEYATPLKTFNDVLSYNGEHSNYYKKYKNEIVLQFYLTLKKILKERTDCTNYCELIFYDDKDENDRYRDVGQVLLERIKKLKRLNEARMQ